MIIIMGSIFFDENARVIMKKEEHKRLYLGKWALAVLCFCAFIGIIIAIYAQFGVSEPGKEIRLSDGWTVVTPEWNVENARLEELPVLNVHRGDVVELHNVIPDEAFEQPVLSFFLVRSCVRVYVEDELVYAYGTEDHTEDWTAGDGFHMIPLPGDCAGKRLDVIYQVSEKGAFLNFRTFTIGELKSVRLKFANEHMIQTFVGGFLMMLGCLVVIISIFALCLSRNYKRLLLTGLFSCCMGVWSLCNTSSFQVFTDNYYLVTLLEYVALYCAPVPVMFLMCDVRKDAVGTRRLIIHASTALVTLFAIACMVLHVTGILRFAAILPYFHIIGAGCLTVTLASVLTGKIRIHQFDKVFFVGVVTFCVTAMLDLLRYNAQKYLWQDVSWLNISILPVGTLIMILFMLVSYGLYLFDTMKDRTRQEALEQYAYCDALTGVYNRNKCREIFRKLDSEKKRYAIVNYDLNELKYVNDHYGHERGDALIQAFASVLTDVFSQCGDVIRMGGDEFIVIIENAFQGQIEKKMKNFATLMERSEKDYGMKLSASYGIAFSSDLDEEGVTTEAVYNLADKRMYEMKKQSKENKEDKKLSN